MSGVAEKAQKLRLSSGARGWDTKLTEAGTAATLTGPGRGERSEHSHRRLRGWSGRRDELEVSKKEKEHVHGPLATVLRTVSQSRFADMMKVVIISGSI